MFRKPNGKPTSVARYLLDEFITLRNDARGHSSQQSAGYYEGLYLKNHLIIQDCIRSCTFLSLPLVYVHSTDDALGRYSYGVTTLPGRCPRQRKELDYHFGRRQYWFDMPVGQRSILLELERTGFLPVLSHLYCRSCFLCRSHNQ